MSHFVNYKLETARMTAGIREGGIHAGEKSQHARLTVEISRSIFVSRGSSGLCRSC